MSKSLILLLCCVVALQCCSKVTYQNVQQVRNGAFKVMIRTREFNKTGSYNVDICIAKYSDKKFPENGSQCFFNGHDFDGLTVQWLSSDVIKVHFDSGRLAYFRNAAIVPNGRIPKEFDILLCNGCAEKDEAGSTKR